MVSASPSLPTARVLAPTPPFAHKDAQEVFESLFEPLSQPHDATDAVMEHKDVQESAIPFITNTSTWYDQFLIPRVPCFISLHTQMMFEKEERVVSWQLRLAWSPYLQANISDLYSFGQHETIAAFHPIPWNPGGYVRGRSNQRYMLFPATNRDSQLLVPGICDGLDMGSPLSIRCDDWVLPPWDSGQQAAASYDQLSCTIRNTACFPGYFVTGSQITLVFTATSGGSHWLVSGVCGPPLSSPFVDRCDKLVLPLWDPGQQAVLSDFTKVACSQAIHDICLKKLIMQSLKVFGSKHSALLPSSKGQDLLGVLPRTNVCVHTSTIHLFIGGFSHSFCLVVMLELQLVRSGSHCVYFQKLQMDTTGIEGGTINSISIMNSRRPKCSESTLAYSVDMAVSCSSFFCTWEGTIFKIILEPTIPRFALQDVSHWLEPFVTSGKIQITAACSNWQLFLCGSSTYYHNSSATLHDELLYVSGICLVIFSGRFHEFQNWLTYMWQHWNSCRPESALTREFSHDYVSEPIPVSAMSRELELASSGILCECLHEIHMARSGIESAALNRMIVNRNRCQIKWPESILVYSAQMEPYGSSISGSSDGAVCENKKVELNNRVSYMAQQHSDLRYFCIQAGLQSLGNSISIAMQGNSEVNKGSYRFDTIVLSYMGFPAARELSILQENIHSWVDSENSVYAEFIWNGLAYEDNKSRGLLCCYHGGPTLFLFLAFDRQAVFQGGGFAMIYRIRYLAHDSYSDKLDYLESSQVPWDPGGSDLLGSSTTTAWGQAVFQGGRGVRGPPYTWTRPHGPGLCWHSDVHHGLGPPFGNDDMDYKYPKHRSEAGIQMDQG